MNEPRWPIPLVVMAELLRAQMGDDYLIHCGGATITVKPRRMEVIRLYYDRGELCIEARHTRKMRFRHAFKNWTRETLRLHPDLLNDPKFLELLLHSGKAQILGRNGQP
jgi:hypothetical protein